MTRVTLDHVGVVARDLAAVAAQYERLGFTLTPFARQADGRIGNRCAMLRHGYVELLAVADPNARSATLERFLARYAGVHILTFAFEDEAAQLARLRRAGIAAPSVSRFDRLIDDTDPAGPRAHFALIQLPDQPEGRINLVHHLTPKALWQERFLHHPNNAASLAEVAIVVSDPADAAARFSRLVGCPVVPDPIGGFALALSRGTVRLLPDSAQQSIAYDGAITAFPRIVGLTVHTTDGNTAITRLLADRGIAHRRAANALLVDADAAGGVALRFVPAG